MPLLLSSKELFEKLQSQKRKSLIREVRIYPNNIAEFWSTKKKLFDIETNTDSSISTYQRFIFNGEFEKLIPILNDLPHQPIKIFLRDYFLTIELQLIFSSIEPL